MTKTFKPGKYDISNEDYHAAAAISRSNLMLLNKTPYHFKARNLYPTKQTPAMLLGSLVHTLVLEPHIFARDYYIAARAIKDEERTKVTQLCFDKASAIARSVLMNTSAMSVMNHCEIEQSIFWEDKETGVDLKSRIDGFKLDSEGKAHVFDLKTSANISPWDFSASAHKCGYFLQAAFIQAALKSIDLEMASYKIVAVENKEPFAVVVYDIPIMAPSNSLVFAGHEDFDGIISGQDNFRFLLRKLKDCRAIDKWETYPTQTLKLPVYAKDDMGTEEENMWEGADF